MVLLQCTMKTCVLAHFNFVGVGGGYGCFRLNPAGVLAGTCGEKNANKSGLKNLPCAKKLWFTCQKF